MGSTAALIGKARRPLGQLIRTSAGEPLISPSAPTAHRGVATVNSNRYHSALLFPTSIATVRRGLSLVCEATYELFRLAPSKLMQSVHEGRGDDGVGDASLFSV